MKIHPVEIEFFRTDWQTGICKEADSRFSPICKMPKKINYKNRLHMTKHGGLIQTQKKRNGKTT